jgi:O-antigen ligase
MGLVQPPLTLLAWLRSAVAAAAVLFFCTGFDLYGYQVYSTPNPMLGIVALVGASLLLGGNPARALRSPVCVWVVAMLVLSTVGACLSGSPIATEMLVNRCKAGALLIAMTLIFDDERARRAGAWAFAAAVVVMAVANVTEVLGLANFADERDTRILGRASGFFYNANESGRAILFALAAGVVLLPARWRLPLVVVAALGAAPTFSRSTWILFSIVALWLLWRRALRFSIPGVAVLLALVVVLLWTGRSVEGMLDSSGALNDNTMARLHFALQNESTSDRIQLAGKAWDLFVSSPIVGHGLGASVDWDAAVSSHNSYLNLAADHGILGLLLLPMLCVALRVANGAVLPATLVLAVSGVFTHNLIDERNVVTALALAAVTRADRLGLARAPAPTSAGEALDREEATVGP